MPAFVPEMLTPLDLYDGLSGQLQGALDMGQGEGIGLAANLDYQTAHHRQRQRHLQVEAAALPAGLGQHNRAA
ncbi:hypothetical protein D9M71_739740 [compost metagenome]